MQIESHIQVQDENGERKAYEWLNKVKIDAKF